MVKDIFMSQVSCHNTSQARVLILGAAYEFIPFLDLLMEQGLYLVCFDKNVALPEEYLLEHKDQLKCYPIDFSDSKKVIEVARKEQLTHSIALPVGRALMYLGTINEQCNFEGPSFHAIDTLTDKNKFHEFCSAHGLNDCPYVLLETTSPSERGSKLELIESHLSYPMIIKPTYGSGSLGAAYIANREELLAYQAPERFKNDTLLVEQCINGTEYNINTFVDKNGQCHILALFQKDVSKPPYRQETAYFIDDYAYDGDKLLPMFNDIARLLNLKSCFLSADAFVGKDDKPYVIDISPRLTGNNVLQLICFIGNNPLAIYKKAIIDKQKVELKQPSTCACLRFFDFDKPFTYHAPHSHKHNDQDQSNHSAPTSATPDAALPSQVNPCPAKLSSAQPCPAPQSPDRPSADQQSCSHPSAAYDLSSEDSKCFMKAENYLVDGQTYGPMTWGHDIYRGYVFVSNESLAKANELTHNYLKTLTSTTN